MHLFTTAFLFFFATTTSALEAADDIPAKNLVNVEPRFIPPERPWRMPERRLNATFITIHSTDNEGKGANARAHANLLSSPEGLPSQSKLSRSGFRSWHFTVDDTRIVQHLPLTEQGDHADFTGPGNQVSIGIEICVNRDGNLALAIERAAALTAHLMKDLNIDIDHVVPHYHWPQPPLAYHKPCPSIFMDNNKPGKKWDAFKMRTLSFRKRI